MPTLPKTTHILLLAEADLSEELVRLLDTQGYRLSRASSVAECLQALQRQGADLLLVVGEEGLNLCRQLRTEGRGVGVLWLVEVDDVENRVRALDCGASDLIQLPIDPNELFLKVRSQVLRAQPPSTQNLQFQDITLHLQTRQVLRGARPIDLTAKEFELLKFLLENPQQVLSREQILQQVWSTEYTGESNVIEVYIRYLRLKLEKEGEKKLIQTVRGVGYALRE